MFVRDFPFSDFQWDEVKRAKNLIKHGYDFEDAMFALAGGRYEKESDRHGESRTLAICLFETRYVAIVYTMRGSSCRIISMRKARPDEQELFDAHDA